MFVSLLERSRCRCRTHLHFVLLRTSAGSSNAKQYGHRATPSIGLGGRGQSTCKPPTSVRTLKEIPVELLMDSGGRKFALLNDCLDGFRLGSGSRSVLTVGLPQICSPFAMSLSFGFFAALGLLSVFPDSCISFTIIGAAVFSSLFTILSWCRLQSRNRRLRKDMAVLKASCRGSGLSRNRYLTILPANSSSAVPSASAPSIVSLLFAAPTLYSAAFALRMAIEIFLR